VVGPEEFVINILRVDSIELTLVKSEINGKPFIVIPEINFIEVKKRSVLAEYILAFQQAKLSNLVEYFDKKQSSTVLTKTLDAFDYSLTQPFVAMSLVFVIAAVSVKMVIYISNHHKSLSNAQTYRSIPDNLLDVTEKLGKLAAKLFGVLFIVYIPIVLLLSYGDRASFDVNYVLNYVSYTLQVSNFSSYIQNENLFRTFFFSYTMILIAFGLIALLPFVLRLLMISVSTVFTKKIKLPVKRQLILLLISLALLVTVIFPLEKIDVFLGSILTAVIFILLLNVGIKRKEWKRGYRFRWVLGLAVLGLLGSIAYNYAKGLPIDYKYKPLFNTKEALVILPYVKTHGDKELFEDFSFHPHNSIFADELMIYHPKYPKIINKSIKKFSSNGDYIVLGGGTRRYVKRLLKDSNLLSSLTVSQTTHVFYVSGLNKCFNDRCYVSMSVRCDGVVKPTDLDVLLHYYDDVDDAYKEDGVTLIHFPGCYEGGDSNFSYTVPLDLGMVANKDVIFEFDGGKGLSLTKFSLLNGSGLLDTKFVSYKKDGLMFASNLTRGGDTLTVYSFGDKEYIVKNDLTKPFNISSVLNDLKIEGRLDSPFRLWSLKENGFVILNEID